MGWCFIFRTNGEWSPFDVPCLKKKSRMEIFHWLMVIFLLKKWFWKKYLTSGYLVCVDKLRTIYGIGCANSKLFRLSYRLYLVISGSCLVSFFYNKNTFTTMGAWTHLKFPVLMVCTKKYLPVFYFWSTKKTWKMK